MPTTPLQKLRDAVEAVDAEQAALLVERDDLKREVAALKAKLAGQPTDALNAVAGRPVHVRLPDADLAALDVEDYRWRWDFGDPDGRHNVVEGFNAAHVYDRPGTYTITLNGRPFARVNVAADPRPVAAVADEAGLNKVKPGTIAQLPVELRLSNPVTLPDDVELRGPCRVVFGPWRDKVWSLLTPGARCTFRNLRFAVEGGPANGALHLDAISARDGTAVIGCVGEDIDVLVNGNAKPRQVYVADNRSLTETGIRRYLAWGEGEDWAVYGNLVQNSRLEHGIRLGASGLTDPGCVRIALCFNDLENLDRRPAGDPHDTAKGDLTMQTGAFGYCYANTFRGPTSVGPLGEGDGLKNPGQRWRVAVFAENRWEGDGWPHVKHGAERVTFVGNVGPAPRVDGFNAQYGRGVVDLVIDGKAWAGAGNPQ